MVTVNTSGGESKPAVRCRRHLMIVAVAAVLASPLAACTSGDGETPADASSATGTTSAQVQVPPATRSAASEQTAIALPSGVNCVLAQEFLLCAGSTQFTVARNNEAPFKTYLVQVGALAPGRHFLSEPVDPTQWAPGDIMQTSGSSDLHVITDAGSDPMMVCDNQGRVAPWAGKGGVLRLTPDARVDANASEAHPQLVRGWSISTSDDGSTLLANGPEAVKIS